MKYELHEVTGHYEDGSYGAQHLGPVIGLGVDLDGDNTTTDPAGYLIQWTTADGEDHDVYANSDLDIMVNGVIVATWVEVG